MNPKDIMTDAIHNFHPQYQQYTQYSSGESPWLSRFCCWCFFLFYLWTFLFKDFCMLFISPVSYISIVMLYRPGLQCVDLGHASVESINFTATVRLQLVCSQKKTRSTRSAMALVVLLCSPAFSIACQRLINLSGCQWTCVVIAFSVHWEIEEKLSVSRRTAGESRVPFTSRVHSSQFLNQSRRVGNINSLVNGKCRNSFGFSLVAGLVKFFFVKKSFFSIYKFGKKNGTKRKTGLAKRLFCKKIFSKKNEENFALETFICELSMEAFSGSFYKN